MMGFLEALLPERKIVSIEFLNTEDMSGEDYDNVRPLYIISVLDHLLDIPGESDEERNQLVRTARLKMSVSEKVLSDKLNYVFSQLPVVKTITNESTFLEKWAWSVRNMVDMSDKPLELNESYFSSLYEHSNRRNIREDILSKYDTMVRDEIQIKAEKEYLFQHAIAEGMAKGMAEGRAEGRAEGEESKQREIAARLKAAGTEIGFISEITGMSLDEVAAL